MLPVNYGGHTAYQNTFVSEFLKLFPDPFAVPKQTWDVIVKFWYLDLSETDTIMQKFYSLLGKPATRFPSCLLRSYLLSTALKESSITEWCRLLKITPLFVQCKDWIQWLISEMLPNEIIHYKKPKELEPYRVIAVDASDIVQKGAVKKTWHLHYGIDLFSLTCNQFKLTEQSTGESLKNFNIEEKDLTIADRAYGTIRSIEHCLNNGGEFIIRIKNKAFNLYNQNREKILLSDWLRTISEKAEELRVYIKDSNKNLIPLRICAVKKTKEEIAIEEKRLKRLESKKQTTYSEDTKFTHEFMFVITSLPASVSAEKVLEYYRLRWQVELVFKRYKSLLGLGNIPTKTKESSEVWLNGKMFLALLIEKYLGDIDFSPSWNIRTEPEHMERDEIGTLFDLYDAVSK